MITAQIVEAKSTREPTLLAAAGLRVMVMTVVVVAVYVTFVLSGSFMDVRSATGVGDLLVRWVFPALGFGAVIFAAGLALFVAGRRRG